MSGYDLYIFAVCFFVFLMLSVLLGTMLVIIVRQEMRMIEHGLEDRKIITEYRDGIGETPFFKTVFGRVMTVIVIIAILFFGFSLYVGFSSDKVEGRGFAPKVVMSDSMSYKRQSNTYLEENGLDDQIKTFDLILTRELPGEFELELYDVVVYEYEGDLIIHRIIGIEEPNEKHPDSRYFMLRGDAMKFSDEFPVEYSQMKAIYKGEKIPFVGSFIAFMQSPAGYLCIIMLVFSMIAMPVAEIVIKKTKEKRLRRIGFLGYEI